VSVNVRLRTMSIPMKAESTESDRDKSAAIVLAILMFTAFAGCLLMAIIGVHWSMWVLALSSFSIATGAVGAARTGKWGRLRKP